MMTLSLLPFSGEIRQGLQSSFKVLRWSITVNQHREFFQVTDCSLVINNIFSTFLPCCFSTSLDIRMVEDRGFYPCKNFLEVFCFNHLGSTLFIFATKSYCFSVLPFISWMHLENHLLMISFALALLSVPLTRSFEVVTSGGRECNLSWKGLPKWDIWKHVIKLWQSMY